MRKHHELKAWQEAISLVREVYAVTREFPPDERFGLTAQLRRAAVSVPSNIAEGAARESGKEFAQFLVLARGPLSELETQVIIAKDLDYIAEDAYAGIIEQLNTTFSLIGGLLRSVRQRSAS